MMSSKRRGGASRTRHKRRGRVAEVSPITRPCDRRVSTRHLLSLAPCYPVFSFTFFDTPCLAKQHFRLREQKLRSLVGPGRLASTTSAVVGTAQDEMMTVQETSPATKKRSVDVAYEAKEDKKLSKSMSASSPSELRRDATDSFAITHAVSIA
jgi:hypothetical protein